jgi:hypothetical protein
MNSQRIFLTIFAALILLSATDSRASAIYLSPGSGHWIQSVGDDGAVVVLEDRSVWLVDVLDRIDTALWLPMTEITVVELGFGYLRQYRRR